MRKFAAAMLCGTAFWSVSHAVAADTRSGNDPAKCLDKTWKGTIGSHEITLYFDELPGESAPAGYYYYGTSPHDLVLIAEASKPGRWKEMDANNKVTGYLTVSCEDAQLTGTWSDPAGKTALALRAESTNEPYAQRRATAMQPIASGPFVFGRFKYETLRSPHYKEVAGSNEIKTVRLLGAGAGIAKINAALRERLDEALQTSIACSSLGRISRGRDSDFEHASEQHILDWNDQFVVLAETSGGYCGGPHPYADSGVNIYRTETGALEDMSSWLTPTYASGISRSSRLGRLLLERYQKTRNPDERECVDAAS